MSYVTNHAPLRLNIFSRPGLGPRVDDTRSDRGGSSSMICRPGLVTLNRDRKFIVETSWVKSSTAFCAAKISLVDMRTYIVRPATAKATGSRVLLKYFLHSQSIIPGAKKKPIWIYLPGVIDGALNIPEERNRGTRERKQILIRQKARVVRVENSHMPKSISPSVSCSGKLSSDFSLQNIVYNISFGS